MFKYQGISFATAFANALLPWSRKTSGAADRGVYPACLPLAWIQPGQENPGV
ncbi:MAG TPA: hypothetical protein P5536_02770 [Methanoregulaceae archaeon]|nr:MAG: hypothetical protein IPI71_09200 [Methanolinea sp.]HON82221.1 hypothetical protein [Methanoregulaceae archaeon]HRT14980.1 hypothetical protein [Methanoregulaceae archaeon]HRU30553.1 hypothetical protein [Methanoregulaceae archaeon]